MKKAIIETRTRNGVATVEGYVNGDFGVHKNGKSWGLTHIPTGLGCGISARTRKDAEDLIPTAIKALEKFEDGKLERLIEEFNELRGVKTMKTNAKTSKKASAKTEPKAKKPTSKEIIARLERENAELKARLESLEQPEIKGIDAFDVEGYLASRDNANRITPELVKAIAETDGLTIERRGADEWLYVTGDTKPHKDIFKAMGFRFSGKETAWFLAPYPLKSPKRYNKHNNERATA